VTEPRNLGGPRLDVTLTPVDFDPFAEPKETVGLPLTDEQAEVWSAAQMGPSASCSFNQCFTVTLRGALSMDALEKALHRVVERHEALRARFDAYGADQTIVAGLRPSLIRRDLTRVTAEERARAISETVLREGEEPFDLANGPLFRAQVLHTGADEHTLVFTAHHLVFDGWSCGILLRDLGALYSGERNGVPLALPAAASYRDYVRQMASPEEKARQRAAEDYWAGRFADAVPVVELPLDRARPTAMSYRGGQETASLPAQFQGELRKLGARHGCTLYVTLLAAFQVLVSRLSRQADVVVGIPLAGQAQIEDGGLIGHCVHTLPMRALVDQGKTFLEHMKVVRGLLLAAHENQATTFGNLVRRLALARDFSRTPLVGIVFNLDKLGAPPEFAGLDVDIRFPEKSRVNFELNLNVMESSAGLTLECSYNADLFDRSTVCRWLGHYRVLLESLVAGGARAITEVTVGRLPIIGEEERRGLLRAPERQYEAGACLHERFERRAAASPDAVAVVCEGASLTYAELNRRANRLAHRLRARGVGPESLVGLSLERSLDLVVGILGILKAGGAYLPLDPDYPRDRLTFMVADAGVRVIVAKRGDPLATEAGCEVVGVDDDEPASEDNLASGATASSLAYVIYTSGSTGRPKGCQVTHGNVTRLFEATDHWFGFDERDVWTLFHSYAFDFTIWELWGALLYGGRLVVVPYWVSRSPDAFFEVLRRERVTVLNQTPSAFRQLIQADLATGSMPAELALRYVIFGGEALDLQSLRPWIDRRGDERPQLVNMYGITETTVHVTYRRIVRKDVEEGLGSMIGIPIPDLCVRVLDAEGEPVPLGVPGEIYVGGAGVARGYLNRPELTAERFVRDPFSADAEARLYRSGDLGRRRAGGDLEYLGRIDHQVKIRGFRIELGEIEAALSQQPGVRETVVTLREEASGDRRLVAYVAGEGDHDALTEDLRNRLRQVLPEYMVPSAFVILDSLPLNQNGKVDKKALPAPAAVGRGRDLVPPQGRVQEVVAAVWKDVLGLESVGAHDNFFDLGGHSMLAARLLGRLRDAFAVDVPLRSLFQQPTIAGLADVIQALQWIDQSGQATARGTREEVEI
jgi:amino acid adenylation domain-containing protein